MTNFGVIDGSDTGLQGFPPMYGGAIQTLNCVINKKDSANDRYTGYSMGVAYIYKWTSGEVNIGFGTYKALTAADDCYVHIFGEYDAAQ